MKIEHRRENQIAAHRQHFPRNRARHVFHRRGIIQAAKLRCRRPLREGLRQREFGAALLIDADQYRSIRRIANCVSKPQQIGRISVIAAEDAHAPKPAAQQLRHIIRQHGAGKAQ